MNAATENNNELGISLLLGGVRGAVYLYKVGRKGGGFAWSSPWGRLCLCDWVYLSGQCAFVFSPYRACLQRGSFIDERRQSGFYKRGGMCLVFSWMET